MSDPWEKTVSPVVWKELRQTTDDISILMEYLTQANDGRLQACFPNPPAAAATAPRPGISPPCGTYAEFLTRLADIRAALTTTDAPEPEPPASAPASQQPVSNVVFLYWSHDFLSVVASPTTADSIKITQHYVQARLARSWYTVIIRSVVSFLSSMKSLGTGNTGTATSGIAQQRIQMAEWISGLVWLREIMALTMTIFVIVLSTYSISGQLILRSRLDVIEQSKDISRRIEGAEKDLYLPATASAAPGVSATVFEAAASGKLPSPGTQTPVWLVPSVTPLCDLIYAEGPEANASKAPENSYVHKYQTVAQINLCAERQRNLNEGIAIAAQILSWLKWMDKVDFVSGMFGDNEAVTTDLGKSPFLCWMVTHKVIAPASAPDQNCGGFQQILEYYGKVPEAILQCLSLYILPSLYGMLGAILATLRYVRGRVALSLLTYVDRGRIQQDWLLGLILGAVIGLFASYIGKTSPIEGITLSAIAFLAGYNVTAVFGLFEDLSNRLFAHGDKPPATPTPSRPLAGG